MEKRSFSKDQVRKMMNYNREEFFKNPTEVRIFSNVFKLVAFKFSIFFRALIVLLHFLRKVMALDG